MNSAAEEMPVDRDLSQIAPEIRGEVMDFQSYRKQCDLVSQGYRKIGIQDVHMYQQALNDNRTVFLDTEMGTTPLIVAHDYVSGFDIERTKGLTGKDSLFFLVAPVELIEKPIVVPAFIKDTAIVCESDQNVTIKGKKLLIENLRVEDEDGDFEAKDFEDERLREVDPNHVPAWIGLYASDVEVIGKATDTKTLEEAFFANGGEVAPHDGYTLLSGPSLSQYPEIIEELWDLFSDRFGWLGDFHPVSMEDTRAWFDEFLTHPTTNTLIRYVGGEAKCAGFYQLDSEVCDWLNSESMHKLGVEQGSKDGKTTAFLAALAARAEDAHYSEDFVKFQCKMAALAGMEYRVLIESSNMSSIYIPKKILEGYMNASGYAHVDIQRIARQDYWYLVR